MSINQFMRNNINVLRDEIIQNIPNKKFDTHEFIRNFAKRFEIDYVNFLSEYEQEPFKTVHTQIGKFLLENQDALRIKNIGITYSPNIFGFDTQNEMWEKII